jgi:hypothetical protein
MSKPKTSSIIKTYLIATLIEGILRTVLIYVIFIIIPAVVLSKPIIITNTFLYILAICIIAASLRMYVISPVLITLAYFLSFVITATNLNFGSVSDSWNVLSFNISLSLDVTLFLVAMFAAVVVPMSLSAFYSYFITQASGNVRRPPIPLTGATLRDILSEILS